MSRVLDQPVDLVEQGRDLLYLVDDDQGRWALLQPFPQQLRSARIITVYIRLEQIDHVGVRQALANPAGFSHLSWAPQERGLSFRKPEVEVASG